MRVIGVAVLLSLLAGCSARPSVQDVEPAMRQAVRTVVDGGADVRRALLPRCGPGDERLEGRRLQLLAEVPVGSVDLEDAARELRQHGLDADVGDGTGAPLLAVASGDGWTAELWPTGEGQWRMAATAEVDGDGATVLGCG